MNKKSLFAGFVIGIALSLAVVLAVDYLSNPQTNNQRTVYEILDSSMEYLDIQVMYEGKSILPIDDAGNTIRAISLDGSIYVPAQSFSQDMGFHLGFNDRTQILYYSPIARELDETEPERIDLDEIPDMPGVQDYYPDVSPAAPILLSAGQYYVGEDMPAGKYDCVAISGSGNFQGDVASLGWSGLNEILGAPGSPWEEHPSYNNLRLADGDTIEIKGDLIVEFVPE